MKARIPSHREFIINFPDSVDSVYAPTFIEDCEPAVKKLQEEYGFEYTVEYVK